MNSVQTAWQANLKVNQTLVDHLNLEMLNARTPGGGYSVAQHLAHIVGTTKYWGSQLDSERLGKLPNLFTFREDMDEEDLEAFVTETDLVRIHDVLSQTAAAAQDATANAPEGHTGELPHSSADAFLIHMLVHDAHHRGQILLALKMSEYPLPDEGSMWMPWKEK